jgi:hypothetical protein
VGGTSTSTSISIALASRSQLSLQLGTYSLVSGQCKSSSSQRILLCFADLMNWLGQSSQTLPNVYRNILTLPCCMSHNETANEYMEDVNKFLGAISTIERSRRVDSQKPEILTCLHFYCIRQASQAHDKVFGLRSLWT